MRIKSLAINTVSDELGRPPVRFAKHNMYVTLRPSKSIQM